MNLILHPRTQEFITHSAKSIPQSLLITGVNGVGLLTIAQHIAASHSPVVHMIEPLAVGKSKSITVEQIRDLYDTVRTRSDGKRIIIIDDADVMTHAAQNAFLKLLEEPGAQTHFILLSHHTDQLLPTIQSRVQQQEIYPIDSNQTRKYLDELGVGDERKKQQLLYIADGLPAELHRLVHDNDYFDASAQRMKDARELLRASTYEKLLIAHRYRDNREQAIGLVEAAIHITRRTLSDNAQTGLVKQLSALTTAYDGLQANHNIRLCLARLVL
jgi:hypothetical protein